MRLAKEPAEFVKFLQVFFAWTEVLVMLSVLQESDEFLICCNSYREELEVVNLKYKSSIEAIMINSLFFHLFFHEKLLIFWGKNSFFFFAVFSFFIL